MSKGTILWHGDHLPVFAKVAREVGVTVGDTFRGALVGLMYGYENVTGAYVSAVSSVFNAVARGDVEAIEQDGAFTIHEGDAIVREAVGRKEEHPEIPDFDKRYVLTLFHARERWGRCVYSQMVYCRIVLALNGITLPKESELRGEYGGTDWIKQCRNVLKAAGLDVDHRARDSYMAVSGWLEDAIEINIANGKLVLPLLNLQRGGMGGWTVLGPEGGNIPTGERLAYRPGADSIVGILVDDPELAALFLEALLAGRQNRRRRWFGGFGQ